MLCLVPASVQGTLRSTHEDKNIYNILKFATMVCWDCKKLSA